MPPVSVMKSIPRLQVPQDSTRGCSIMDFKKQRVTLFLADRSPTRCRYCQLLSMIKGQLLNSLYRKEFSPEAEFKFDSYVLLIRLPSKSQASPKTIISHTYVFLFNST